MFCKEMASGRVWTRTRCCKKTRNPNADRTVGVVMNADTDALAFFARPFSPGTVSLIIQSIGISPNWTFSLNILFHIFGFSRLINAYADRFAQRSVKARGHSDSEDGLLRSTSGSFSLGATIPQAGRRADAEPFLRRGSICTRGARTKRRSWSFPRSYSLLWNQST